MTLEEFSPYVLNLCGYITLGQNGFALPCFASGEKPNTWYVANCSVPGDHLGIITDFQAFSSKEIVLLSQGDVRQVRVGDPWCDVFLWRDKAFVGRPSELWQLLQSQHLEIVGEAPISLLDLALFSDAGEVASYAKYAFSFINSRFGKGRALRWRCNLLFRPMITRSIQRLICKGKLSASLEDVREVDVVEIDEESYCVQLPPTLADEIVKAKLTDLAFDELRTLAGALSLSIHSKAGENAMSHAFTRREGFEEVEVVPGEEVDAP